MTGNHYMQHPLISSDLHGQPLHLVRNAYISALSVLLSNHNALLLYSINNWYQDENFRSWGRLNNEHAMAKSKTRMTVESHWSLLKRHQLRNFNRPRSDLLIYLMEGKVLPKYEENFSLLISGRSKPVWWCRFTSSWMREAAAEIRNSYEVDHETWICQCSAYKNNEFLLCKHLVKGKTMPNYRELGRINRPPFIISKFVVDRPFPNSMYEFREDVATDVETNVVEREIRLFQRPLRISIESTEEKQNFIAEARDILQWSRRHLEYLEDCGGSQQQEKYFLEKNS